MKKGIVCILLGLLIPALLSAQKVGLVMSGGGAKGAAHIGVIKALEENGIPIDYITGTSIGAIIGSLYAMGYTPEEMLNLLLSDDFFYWQTGTVEEQYTYFFREPLPTPEFAHFSIEKSSDSLQIKANFLPQSLINPIQMNQAFMGLFSQATAKAGWNFDNLFVPFRCVAADIYAKKAVIFRHGDLGDAVRASMSFPFVFPPIRRDSIPLFDGGIYDNFPIQPMKEAFHPDFIFGSAVSGTQQGKVSENMYNQLETMIMQTTNYSVDEEDGLMVQFNFPTVSLLDFQKGKELMDIGYERTLLMIDSIKARVPRRVSPLEVAERRKAYRESLPPLLFKNIYVSGVTDEQRKYVEAQLHRDINDEFSMEEFKRAYFKMLTYSKIKEIIPHAVYNRVEKKFDLHLDVKMKEELQIGFGGNVSSHQANQLYLGLGYQALSRVASEYHAGFQVGNSFSGVLADARLYLQTRIPMYLNGMGVYSDRRYSQTQSMFYEDVVPAFIKQQELYARINFGFPLLNHSKIETGVSYGRLQDHYLLNNNTPMANASFEDSWYNLFSVYFGIIHHSLNAKQYPTAGRERFLVGQFVNGTENYTPAPTSPFSNVRGNNVHWFQVKGRWLKYQSFSSKFSIGYLAEAVISDKELMTNYTASILQAPAFTPTPHSKIVFNEAFRSNQYAAGGVIPILKLNRMLHLRSEFYAFAPLKEILKDTNEVPYYDKWLHSFHPLNYMGELSLVLQLPFASVSVYANGYSYPKQNFNFGLNIGYLIFNPKMLD